MIEINEKTQELKNILNSARADIASRKRRGLYYINIVDEVIKFAQENKKEISPNEIGGFLFHYATYSQLRLCMETFDFDSDMLELLQDKQQRIESNRKVIGIAVDAKNSKVPMIKLLTSAKEEINKCSKSGLESNAIVQHVINFSKIHKNEIDEEILGEFLIKYGNYSQLKFSQNEFDFSDNLKHKIDAKILDLKDKNIKTLEETKELIQVNGIGRFQKITKNELKDLTAPELLDLYSKTNGKCYSDIFDELQTRTENAKTFGEKKKMHEAKQAFYSITKIINAENEKAKASKKRTTPNKRRTRVTLCDSESLSPKR